MHHMKHARLALPLLVAIVASACGAAAPTQGSVALTTATPAATPQPATPTPAPTPVPTATPTPEPDYTKEPQIAHDLEPLIKQALESEKAIRDPNVTGQKLRFFAWQQQLVYGQLANYPEWMDPLVAAMPADIRPQVKLIIEAGKELRRLRGPTPKTFPDWRIVEPKPAETLITYYKEAAQRFGIDWTYLAAINLVETRMGRIRGVSSAGAQGPMQFMPGTWAAYGLGGNVEDERDAIMGAANYLKASGAPGDMDRALFAYNRHIGYVNAIKYYAQVLQQDANVYRGYHGWQVYYPTVDGIFHLAPGWTKPPTP
jgi:soluble lytic murein transglycosylase-like protein